MTNKFRLNLFAIFITITVILVSPLELLAKSNKIPEPYDNAYANDYASVLTQDTINYIININQQLYDQTGAQVVVVTVDFTNSMSISDFSYELFNQWGIGSKEKNNGLLLVLSIAENDYYVEEGIGLENKFTIGEISEILSEYMLESFEAQNYDYGVRNTFDAFIYKLNSIYGTNISYNENYSFTKQNDFKSNYDFYSKNNNLDYYYPSENTKQNNNYTATNFVAIIITVIVIFSLVILTSNRNARRYYTPRRRRRLPIWPGRYYHHRHYTQQDHPYKSNHSKQKSSSNPFGNTNSFGGGSSRGRGTGRNTNTIHSKPTQTHSNTFRNNKSSGNIGNNSFGGGSSRGRGTGKNS